MDQRGLMNIVDTIEKIAVALAKELLSKLWKLLLKWIDKVLKILNADVSIIYAGFKLFVKKAANACKRYIRAYYLQNNEWYMREREDRVRISDVPDAIQRILRDEETDATSILERELR